MTPPTKSSVLAAYNHWHETLGVETQANCPWHDLVRAHLNPEDLAVAQSLEIGCGRGGFACWLARQAPRPTRIYAADFASSAVAMGQEFASQNGISGITWMCADIQNLPFAAGSFDTIFSLETVEHVPDPPQAFRELARVLKPGGRLLLSTPNYFSTIGLYRVYLGLRGRVFTEEGQPINHFTRLPLTIHWARSAGLRVTAVDGIGHYLHIPRRTPVRLSWLDRPRGLMKWFAAHSLVVAVKP
jgi:2-polyprenyl-3-methyl-5-hydroxy-6-metoxy-1,4-benzoquinol methylase